MRQGWQSSLSARVIKKNGCHRVRGSFAHLITPERTRACVRGGKKNPDSSLKGKSCNHKYGENVYFAALKQAPAPQIDALGSNLVAAEHLAASDRDGALCTGTQRLPFMARRVAGRARVK